MLPFSFFCRYLPSFARPWQRLAIHPKFHPTCCQIRPRPSCLVFNLRPRLSQKSPIPSGRKCVSASILGIPSMTWKERRFQSLGRFCVTWHISSTWTKGVEALFLPPTLLPKLWRDVGVVPTWRWPAISSSRSKLFSAQRNEVRAREREICVWCPSWHQCLWKRKSKLPLPLVTCVHPPNTPSWW